ncbi:hypothetical protein PENSPDRAFT_656853 [Peniophora sp. CONT]|nr:hypothetical protein PENSPDRAFT_656853 [Peniophora sp. CONT]
MAEHTYEIASFPAADAVKKDLSVCKPVIEVTKRHTSLPVFVGISVESAKLYVVATWENTDAHRKFIAHPDYKFAQADFASLLPEGGAAGISIVHAHFNADPLPLFAAPVVEHAFLTPEDGVTLDELKAALLRSNEVLAQHRDLSTGAVIGTMEERPDQLIVIAGWQSLEAHQKFAAPGGPAGDGALVEIFSKVKKEIAVVEHVSYTKLA